MVLASVLVSSCVIVLAHVMVLSCVMVLACAMVLAPVMVLPHVIVLVCSYHLCVGKSEDEIKRPKGLLARSKARRGPHTSSRQECLITFIVS